jgi:hypothetical protein
MVPYFLGGVGERSGIGSGLLSVRQRLLLLSGIDLSEVSYRPPFSLRSLAFQREMPGRTCALLYRGLAP